MSAAWARAAGLLATAARGAPAPEVFDALPAPTWAVELPGGVPPSPVRTELGGPVFAGDRILVGHAEADALLVLHREDGRLLARLRADAPVQSRPVVRGSRVWFADTAGTTWCYDLASGALEWRHGGGAPVASAPALDGGRLYVADLGDVVVALDADTGELAWRHAQPPDPGRRSPLRLYGAPTPLPIGDVVVVGFSDGTVAGLDAATGDVRWQRRVGEGDYPDVIAPAVAADGLVVVAGYEGPAVALDPETRDLAWRLDSGLAAAPLVRPGADGAVLVLPGTDGVLRAVRARTGEVLWEHDTETGSALATPLDLPVGLVVAESGGGLRVVDPEDGALAWRYEPLRRLSGITAPPAVSGRQLVALTNAGRLLSFVAPRGAGREARR